MSIIKSLFDFVNSSTLNSASTKSIAEQWPQINTYYEILSKTFHASEKGNLEPIKSNSEILLEKVEELTIENMPSEYRNPKTIETLLTLNKQTKLVNELVKKQDHDSEIKSALKRLHDIFSSITQLCIAVK